MKPTIITLTGPSCAGKSTLEKLLSAHGMSPLMSTTTRAPRPGEVDGVHYNFMSKSEFRRIREQGGFIEHVEFGGNYYGLSLKVMNVVAAENKPAVVVVEPDGKDQIVAFGKRHGWDIFTVFVDNPSEVIAKRFLERVAAEVSTAAKIYQPTQPVVDTYAKRLSVMLDKESMWRLGAYTNTVKYDLVIKSFDSDNTNEVILAVTGLLIARSDKRKAA